jgi:hypothetical protein
VPVKEYEIYVPLSYNDGSAIEPRKFQQLQKRLVEQFEGLTFLPQPNQGTWKMGGVTYHDEIVIYRVQTAKVRSARRFLLRLKKDLEQELQQEKILIVEKDITYLE